MVSLESLVTKEANNEVAIGDYNEEMLADDDVDMLVTRKENDTAEEEVYVSAKNCRGKMRATKPSVGDKRPKRSVVQKPIQELSDSDDSDTEEKTTNIPQKKTTKKKQNSLAVRRSDEEEEEVSTDEENVLDYADDLAHHALQVKFKKNKRNFIQNEKTT
jgi:hypothetical protein